MNETSVETQQSAAKDGTVWYPKGLPTHLVTQAEGKLWMVPLRPGGWRDRSAYLGGLERLRDCKSRGGKEDIIQLATLGVPGAAA